MTEKSTTIKAPVEKVGTNPLLLPWPSDEYGITSMLKKEGARSVGRINGDDVKLQTFLDTVRVLVAYAREKHALQKKVRAEYIATEPAHIERGRAEAEQMRLRTIKRLEAQIESLSK